MLKDLALKTVQKHSLINNNDYVIIGLSGGADSITLTHFLKNISNQFNLTLRAVYVNHCIRPKDVIKDISLVSNFCSNLSIPLEIFEFDIPKEAKKLSLSEEEAGRIFRYKAFNLTMEKFNANKIAVAHNKNDNAETVILNLCRGTGLKGLCGIPFKRDNIIRPLLECSRKEIETYCEENNLNYIIDCTNNLDIYTRNNIRLNLLPFLEQNFNKNIINSLSNTANLLKEDEDFIESFSKDALDKIIKEKTKNYIIIDLDLLKNYKVSVIKRIFILICNYFNLFQNISNKHICMLLDLINKQSGKSVNLPNNICFKKEHNTFLITNKNNELSNYNYSIKLNEKIYIKEINKFIFFSNEINNIQKNSKKVYTIYLNYDTIKNTLILRNRNNGDRIFLKSINNYKKLKDLFIDMKIPSHKRNLIPVLATEDEVVAVLGIKVSDYFKANEKTTNIAYIQFWEEY